MKLQNEHRSPIFCFSFCFLVIILFGSPFFPVFAQSEGDRWLQQLLLTKASPFLRNVLAQPDSFQYQIIYTQMNRDKKNRPYFTRYYYNVDRERYFNPASTVKLPTALAALEKLHKIKKKGVDKYTFLRIDSAFSGQTAVAGDSTSATGYPSIAHYIKKLFLVSDNDAYNRLYEFVGQERLNKMLRKKGYANVRITRRFVPMTEEENRHTNPFAFLKNGVVTYQQPAATSRFPFDFRRQLRIGRAHWDRRDSLVEGPMDFTKHNSLPLEDLQSLLQSVLFPASVPKKQRFDLSADDYSLLRHVMSALPRESRFPSYDTTEYFDSYTKFFFKSGKQKIPASIRIFNKAGWSYGFLTDAAYVVDFQNGIEFMLAAVIYVNADGILNDNKYEYDTIGYPFFQEIYSILYQFEKERKRPNIPDLSTFAFMAEE